jgi:hypothetical protein
MLDFTSFEVAQEPNIYSLNAKARTRMANMAIYIYIYIDTHTHTHTHKILPGFDVLLVFTGKIT